MSRSKKKLNRKLSVQGLENRKLFAVDAFVNGGDLFVNSDGASDNVHIQYISSGVNAGDYRVYNNGVEIDTFDNVTDDIRVNMGAGNDTLSIYWANLQNSHGDVVVDMGTGHDNLWIHGVKARDMVLETEGYNDNSYGNDRVGIYSGTEIRRDLTIRTRDGRDEVQIFNTEVGDDIWMYTGDHDDEVEIDNVIVEDWLRVHTEGGNDSLDVARTEARVGDFRGGAGIEGGNFTNDIGGGVQSSKFEWLNWNLGTGTNWVLNP